MQGYLGSLLQISYSGQGSLSFSCGKMPGKHNFFVSGYWVISCSSVTSYVDMAFNF